jgi:peptide methionine sulfoxide reductase MsrA
LWGVQAFFKTIPGIVSTEAGRANGTTYLDLVDLNYKDQSLQKDMP